MKKAWTRPLNLNVVDLGTGERLTYSLPSSVGYPSLLALRNQVGLFNTRSGTLFAFDVERRELGVVLLGYGETALKAQAQGFSLAGTGIFRLENNLLVDVSQQLYMEIAGKSLIEGNVDSVFYREGGGIGALAVREKPLPAPNNPGLWLIGAVHVTSVLTFSTADSAKISQVEIPFATRVAPALSWDGRFLMFFDEDRGKLVFCDHRLGVFSDSVDLRSRSLRDVTLLTRYD